MTPYINHGDQTIDPFTALTIDMELSEPACPITDVEEMIIEQRGAREVPFPGMDKSGRGVCIKNEINACLLGNLCPLRHIVKDKQVVCKHWLRGLCKKGDQCEFLHEYDLSKMPECFFFSKYLACSNRECPFRHIDPESKIRDCPWYDRGFCRHGPFCKHRHRRRVICPFFLVGFCLDGPTCKFTHPTFDLPDPKTYISTFQKFSTQTGILCHNCHERGHKATFCPHLPAQSQASNFEQNNLSSVGLAKSNLPHGRKFSCVPNAEQPNFIGDKKSLSEVTCYKCGEKGHYANRCYKGVLAFLSTTAHLAMEQREKDQINHQLPKSFIS